MKIETLKTVGVKELKNKLSAYLREVKLGTRFFLTDRSEIVAELRPVEIQPTKSDSLYESWVREGKLIPPQLMKQTLLPKSTRLKASVIQKLLDEDRGD